MKIPQHTQVKLKQATELGPIITALCLQEVESPDDRRLVEISSYVGTMTNSFRSALNYTMQDLCTEKLAPILPSNNCGSLNLDFPCAKTQAEFAKIKFANVMAGHFKDGYALLERVQPYHKGQEWLQDLREISNQDKHIEVVGVRKPDITDVVRAGFRAAIIDGKVISSYDDGPTAVQETPCFVKPYEVFASSKGQWVTFWIPRNGRKLGLIGFISLLEREVPPLVAAFYETF